MIDPAVIEKLKREKLEREYEERRIPLYVPIPRNEPPPPPNNGEVAAGLDRMPDPSAEEFIERRHKRDNIEACDELLRLLIKHHPEYDGLRRAHRGATKVAAGSGNRTGGLPESASASAASNKLARTDKTSRSDAM